MVLVLINSSSNAVLAIAVIHNVIYNNGNKTLSTIRYSARLTRPTNILRHQGVCKALSVELVDIICIKSISYPISL